MAIKKCPECGTDVSDKAEKCPKCSYPIADSKTQEEVQTIQQTSKRLKKQIIYSALAIITGIITSVSGYRSSAAVTIGILITIIGLIWLIVAKIKIWWHHK